MPYLRLFSLSEPVTTTVIHPKQISSTINMPSKRLFEKLDLAKAFRKINLREIVKRAVEKTGANKYRREHDREDILLGLIASITVKAEKTQEISEFAEELKNIIGIKSFPERSTLSRLWPRIDEPLYDVFLELSTKALKLAGRKISFGNVIALDVQGIISKCRISRRGFVKGKVANGLKLHLKTVNGVPSKVFFSDASVHDSYYVDEFLEDIGECDHVVVDRAFFDMDFMVELAKRDVSFTTRTKRNIRFNFVEEFADGNVLVKRYKRVVDGVTIWRFKGISLEDGQTVFDIVTTLDDYKFALALYELRWDIEVVFRHLSNMGFRLFGYSYAGFVCSVLLFLVVYLLILIYAKLARRRMSVSEMRDKFGRWFRWICGRSKPP